MARIGVPPWQFRIVLYMLPCKGSSPQIIWAIMPVAHIWFLRYLLPPISRIKQKEHGKWHGDCGSIGIAGAKRITT